MIISCPSCATRYRLGPNALGRAGREVRCAKCGHRWHQPAPAERIEPVEISTAASTAPARAAKRGRPSVADLPLVPTLMLFGAGTSLGLTFSLNRIAITSGIPFIPYVFWQALGAGLLLLALSFILRRPPGLTLGHFKVYAMFGSIAMAAPLLVLNFVAAKLPAGVVGLQQTLVPMLTYAFALLLRIEKVNAIKLTGLGVGLGAVLVVVLPQTSLPSPDMAIWVLVSFLTPLCYGIANVTISLMRPPQSTSVALAAAILLTASIYMGLVMLATGEWWWFGAGAPVAGGLDSSEWWWFESAAGGLGPGEWSLIAVVLINAFFFWLLLEIIRLAGPVFFSVQNYVATLAGIAWGILFHSEAHSLWIWLALVLLFFGLALVIAGSLRAEARR